MQGKIKCCFEWYSGYFNLLHIKWEGNPVQKNLTFARCQAEYVEDCGKLTRMFRQTQHNCTLLMTPQNEDEDVSSFALMFGCKERGIRMHGSSHLESQHFHKAFPNTRLVGGFDLGEFYREILDHHPKIVTDSPPTEIHFIHVSVFFLVSYRHPKV